MVERFSVTDEIAWGKLVKSWATGNSYFPGITGLAVPRTLQDIKDQCALVGIGVSIPAMHTGLLVVQSSEEVFVIKLPSKTLVEATEAEMAAGAGYPLPKFYDTFYRDFGTPLNLPNNATKLDFHAARIGDYSIRMCG
jgi:hypothetical protein